MDYILENKNMVYYLANKYKNYGDIEDLRQAGFKGLIQAYQKYDPNKGKFSSYAYYYILGEIKNEIFHNKLIKPNKELSILRNKILKVKNILTQKLMYEPTNEEISNYLEIPLEKIEEALKNYTYEDIEKINYKIRNKDFDQDKLIYLKDFINNLKEPDKSIMIKRYIYDLTEDQTAKQLNLSQVTVSRHEKKILQKLRN